MTKRKKAKAKGALGTLQKFISSCRVARDSAPTHAKKKRRKKSRRDPAWYGHSAAHSKAAKKGARRRKKSGTHKKRGTHKRRTKKRSTAHRDPKWYGHRAGHRKAAKKGWRRGHHMKKTGRVIRHRRDPAGYAEGDPRHYGGSMRHGPRHHGPRHPGHHPGMSRMHRDPAGYRRSRLGRRTSAVHPWRFSHDPE